MANLSYNQETELGKKLFLCTNEADIENVFNLFNVKDISQRISYLRRSMGVETVYDAPQKGLTKKDEYEFECEAFTEGSWRLLN